MFRRRILYPTTIKHKIVVTCESKTYNAQVQVATDVSVVMSGKTLVEGVDYEIIENEGGITVGSYTFVVKGIGKYSDFQQGTFSITKVTPTVTAPTPITNIVYDGTTYFAKFTNKSDSSKFILFPSVGYYEAGTKKEGASYVWTATNNSGAYKQFKIYYNGCVVQGGNPTINYGFPVRGVKNKS